MSREVNATYFVEMQLAFGKQAVEMITAMENNDLVNGRVLPFDFNGHKYKMTIEKDNGDE